MAQTAIVVGGGISGLVGAYKLAIAGKSVTVIEASKDLGGLIKPLAIAGVKVDAGAEAFATIREDTLELIEALGLHEQIVRPAASDSRIMADGVTYKIPHGLFGIPANLDAPEVLAAIGEEGVAEAKRLDSQPWNLFKPTSVAELVSTRLGDQILEKFVTPVIAGVHASQPSMLGIQAVAPGLFAMAESMGSLSKAVAQLRGGSSRPGAAVASLRGGMHGLVTALTNFLTLMGVRILRETPVQSVRKTEDGYAVHPEGLAPMFADILVMATPPHVSARIMTGFPELAEHLGAIQAVDVAVAVVHIVDSKLNDAPFGSGVLIAPGESTFVAKAATQVSAKWQWVKAQLPDDHHIVRLSYGRDGVVPPIDHTLVRTARIDASILFGIPLSNITQVELVSWPKSLVQPRNNHPKLLVDIAEIQARYPNLALVGSGLGGNGITGILAKVSSQIAQIGN